jgi:uncharacterized repeat protein (TIGR01451 family)
MSCPHVERSRWYWARGCAALVLALLALAPWAGPVQAAPTFSVNSTLDEPDAFVGDAVCSSTPSGQCTLRAAVQEGQAVNRAVVVPAGLYELTLGQLVVTQNLTLTGAGSGKTKLDGKLMSRIFDIGATGFAYIGDVTIQWGIGGQSVVVNTHYHGGAIHNHGTLILVDSTVRASSSNNGAWGGGGIFNVGTATLENVTITGNSTWARGGGIENSGTLNVYNSTIVSNQAFGASPAGGGISGNGMNTMLKNTIVANNFDGGNCSGTIVDNGFNLDSGTTCGFPAGRSNRDPMLGLRDENDVYPLLSGSPAIDFGTNTNCPSADQRGAARPQDGDGNGIAICDVGAYEVVPPDLSISYMADSPDPVQPGSSLIYTIDVYNPGPATLTNVVLTDNLPAGVTYTGFAETRGGSCGHVGGVVTCDLGALDGNLVWTMYIYTTVNPTAAGTIVNTASVTASGSDPNPANNVATESTTVTPQPEVQFSSSSYSINEGNGTATVTVQLSAASGEIVTVDYATSNGTATAPGDYTSRSGTLTFNPGQTSKTFDITIVDDSQDELDETVNLVLSNPSGALLGTPSSAILTIQDNDAAQLPAVTVSASDPSAAEAGLDSAAFTITRSGGTAQPLIVHYSAAGTATAGSDYQALLGAVTIPAGQASAMIVVTPVDDAMVEGNETVVVTLSTDPAYTIGASASATVTIADDDTPTPTVTISASDPSAAEAGLDSGAFTITRSGSTATSLVVHFSVGGTATGGGDYTALTGVVTIPVGQASATIALVPIDDTRVEGSETVVVTLSANPTYALGTSTTATVTIADDDPAPAPQHQVYLPMVRR